MRHVSFCKFSSSRIASATRVLPIALGVWLQSIPGLRHPTAAARVPANYGRYYTQRSEKVEKSLNIFVDDLEATLQAHREWNHTYTFSKIAHIPRGRSKAIKTGIVSASLIGEFDHVGTSSWPADSVQALKRQGFTDASEIAAAQSKAVAEREVLEYTGSPQSVQNEWAINASRDVYIRRPWLAYTDLSARESPAEYLSAEVKGFEGYMRLTRAEQITSKSARNEISEALGGYFNLHLLGSRKRDLASPLSDMDLSLTSKDPTRFNFSSEISRKAKGGNIERHSKILMLRSAFDKLKKPSIPFKDQELVYGKVPLIRLQHISSGLKIQIQGPVELGLQDELVRTYIYNFPALRPIFVALRHSLQVRNLSSAHEGGIGSYSLFMMIVIALQCGLPHHQRLALGDQFLHVLRFWADFDIYNSGYTVEPPSPFDKRSGALRPGYGTVEDTQRLCLNSMPRLDVKKPYLLCVQDCADYNNDLGKKSYAIKHIQSTFGQLHQEVTTLLSQKNLAGDTTESASSVLAPVLEADYLHFEAHRSHLERLQRPTDWQDTDYTERRLKEDLIARAEVYKELGKYGKHAASTKRQEELIRKFQIRR